MVKPKRRPPSSRLRNPLAWLLLLILLGGFFRLCNPDWDFQEQYHPDERNIMSALGEIRQDNGYRTTFFAYGQLPVYLYKATAEVLSTPLFWSSLFQGHPIAADLTYWLFLAGLWAATLWFFTRTQWDFPAFVASTVLFVLALLFKFEGVFNLWFQALEGQQAVFTVLLPGHPLSLALPVLPVAGLFLAATASVLVSLFVSKVLDLDWFDLPLYLCAGAVFLLGILPDFLPEGFHLPALLSGWFFSLLLIVPAVYLAWISKGARAALGAFALWTLFASLPHGGAYDGNQYLLVTGRVWSALFSTATIGALYFLALRIYGSVQTALVAAAGFAFAVISIENAHYMITESFISLMLVVVALFSYEILRKGDWKSYLWAGAAFGLAMAAKTSVSFYVLIIVIAHLLRLSQKSRQVWEGEDRRRRKDQGLYTPLAWVFLALMLLGFLGVGLALKSVLRDLFMRDPGLGRGIWAALFLALAASGAVFFTWGALEFKAFRGQMPEWVKLAAAGGTAFFVCFLFSPWNLLDTRGFFDRQNYEWSVVSIADAPYTLQFRDTPRYLFQLKNLLEVELWWPLGLAVLAGTAWVLGRFLFALVRPVKRGYVLPMPLARGKGFAFSPADLLLLLWFIAYFGFVGAWNTKFARYMAPLIPAFCLFGARFLTDLLNWLKARVPSGFKILRPALLAAVLGPSLFYSLAYMHVYFYPHPWIDDSVWIYQHVPQGSVIGSDEFDDGMPEYLTPQFDSRVDRVRSPEEYKHLAINPYECRGFGGDNENTIPDLNKQKYYVEHLQKCDYISLATKKLWYTLTDATPEFRPKGFNNYPITSRYYRLLWSGLAGYRMVAEFHNFPSLFGWEHPDDWAEESFSVYDHPRAYLFKKVEAVPPERLLKLLSSDDYVKGINRDVMLTITPENVDAFIAQRRKYLEDQGLLKGLEDTPGVTPTPGNGAK